MDKGHNNMQSLAPLFLPPKRGTRENVTSEKEKPAPFPLMHDKEKEGQGNLPLLPFPIQDIGSHFALLGRLVLPICVIQGSGMILPARKWSVLRKMMPSLHTREKDNFLFPFVHIFA